MLDLTATPDCMCCSCYVYWPITNQMTSERSKKDWMQWELEIKMSISAKRCAHTKKKSNIAFCEEMLFLLLASFCLYSQPTLTPLARLIFVKCVQQRAEAPLRNTNGAQINLFPVADFLWLVWDPARRWCRLQTLPDWLTAGICQRWQVQTAVWQPQLMNNEWVETRRPGESISPLDSFHHSYIPESAKTP